MDCPMINAEPPLREDSVQVGPFYLLFVYLAMASPDS